MNSLRYLPILFTLVILGGCGAKFIDKHHKQQLDFWFHMEGERYRLSESMGHPVVLVLMRTSDITSQIYMQELRSSFDTLVTKQQQTVEFIVLTIEPSEGPFVDAYAESEELPFAVGIAETALKEGKSLLGSIPVIPLTLVIDSQGVIRDLAPGSVTPEQLNTALAPFLEN